MARLCPDPSCAKKYPDTVSFCGECGSIAIEEQWPDDFDARLGQRLGSYLVVARIADGAMGRVYEGRPFETRARVAIKVLHADVARDAVAVERFRREYETAQEMSHPNIVKVIEFGATPEGPSFMTMEYLEGEELGYALRRDGKLPTVRLLRMVCQLAQGLDYAHSFGFIHRDLKPDNVFLCRDPRGDMVRILDFGSVKLQMETGPKLTAFGTTLGSPFYMSPEQAMGKQDVDHRTDVFALAAIAYEAMTGRIAFEAGNIAQILMKIINENPTPPAKVMPSLPPLSDQVIEKGLKKDKLKRFDSASAFASALCDAYGISGDVARWATANVTELETAVAAARPPAPPASDKLPPAASLPKLNTFGASRASQPARISGVGSDTVNAMLGAGQLKKVALFAFVAVVVVVLAVLAFR